MPPRTDSVFKALNRAGNLEKLKMPLRMRVWAVTCLLVLNNVEHECLKVDLGSIRLRSKLWGRRSASLGLGESMDNKALGMRVNDIHRQKGFHMLVKEFLWFTAN